MLNYIRYRARETRIVTSEGERSTLADGALCFSHFDSRYYPSGGYTTGDGEREYGLVQQSFFRVSFSHVFHFSTLRR